VNIYADHNATSPVSRAHWDDVSQLLFAAPQVPANASSPHAAGRRARDLVETARRNLAALIGVHPKEVVFTASATEANNMVIQSFAGQGAVASGVEHPSVLEPLKACASSVDLVPPFRDTRRFLAHLQDLIRPETKLVTLVAGQNETGQLLPVKEFGDWLHQMRFGAETTAAGHGDTVGARDAMAWRQIHFHVDATQVLGKVPAQEWMSLGIDSLAVSGHKVGALPGIGALILRQGRPLRPLLFGGSQERSRRAGTENLVGIVSFGARAASLAQTSHWRSMDALHELTRKLEDLLSSIPGLTLLSSSNQGLPNTVFALVNSKNSVRAEDLIIALDLLGIQASTGSACSTGVGRASQGVRATVLAHQEEGLLPSTLDPEHAARNGLRFSLGLPLCDQSQQDKLLDTLRSELGRRLDSGVPNR
jgi:cysteine desulfurase